VESFQVGISDRGLALDSKENVWAANNWESVEAVSSPNPPSGLSTHGGGSGLTIIYGVAAPVQPPRMGKVRSL
jgi:hypothetical protein